MNEYFDTFRVERANFDFSKYWPPETFILYALLTCGGNDDEPLPLTLHMLAKSAREGKWLYD